ncbi:MULTISPECIES: lipid-A-disaccharide synthase N-terminal domain-containing protein [Rhodomicrobium]|uniref:lipid-A-disaccharide synthase N-terminal domain-containing protein n=1 Tax=Rhodomicrobium TaxID=1068 RepID=UPI000B4B603C|nr:MULTISPECIES: lipid-A-disaccharide synthase N-terminal domain-containing protein [Rhodomicrobium]
MDYSKLVLWWTSQSTAELIWLGVGFAAQAMFSMRFIVQWLASEKARRSVVPETFWYFSFIGGLMLFIYSIYRMDPVFILGQGSGLFIYARNIYFIRRTNRESAAVVQPGYNPAAE